MSVVKTILKYRSSESADTTERARQMEELIETEFDAKLPDGSFDNYEVILESDGVTKRLVLKHDDGSQSHILSNGRTVVAKFDTNNHTSEYTAPSDNYGLDTEELKMLISGLEVLHGANQYLIMRACNKSFREFVKGLKEVSPMEKT